MFWKRQFMLHSKLSAEECVERLRKNVELNISLIDWLSSKPVMGKIRGYEFRLRKRTYYGNPFTSYLYGELQGDASGTRVIGRFRLHPLARFLVPSWFVSALAINLFCVFDSFGRKGSIEQAFRDCMFGFGTVVFGGILVYGSGRLLGRWCEKFLRRFLATILSAEPVSPGTD